MSNNQVTETHYKNFVATFYKFLYDINRYVPTVEMDDILTKYKDFDMVKVIFRVHKLLKASENYVHECDAALFSSDFFILPSINLSFYWQQMNTNQKKKIWTYLSMLMLQTDIFYDMSTDNVEIEKIVEKPTVPEFNPYVGIGCSTQNYCVNDILCSIPTIEEDQPMGIGIDAITKMMGLDKMININEISDKLRNMTDEDLDKATTHLKMAFGAENDPATSNFIESMVGSLADEIKKDDGEKSLQKTLEAMAPKVQASIEENGLDVHQLMNSAKNFAKQQKGNGQMFGGLDPFAMLERFAGGAMSEQECKKECDNMMKTMSGMNMGNMGNVNMEQMLGAMQQGRVQNNNSRGRGRKVQSQRNLKK